MIRLALAGDPVDHSLSPILHTEALRLSGIEGEYTSIRADTKVLESLIERLREGALHGLNITMPLKKAAFELCEKTTAEASSAGSVNTMRSADGLIVGHSTDSVAFRQIYAGLDPSAPLLVLGAGASAQAAIDAWPGPRRHVAARDESRARALGVGVVAWGTPVVGCVLVNATPLGMKSESLPDGLIAAAEALVDLPYGTGPTPAAQLALRLGVETHDGLEFLARQAAAAFHWWTGADVDWSSLLVAARKT